GSLVHNPLRSDDKHYNGNSEFYEGDEVILEINMAVEREQRTLHFFVKGRQQPISFVGLPNSVKFCVQRQFAHQLVKIISFEKVPQPTVRNVPNGKAIKW
ncbi:MAG: hypothetical protein EZS28_038857, partial [Streblomastix strix]